MELQCFFIEHENDLRRMSRRTALLGFATLAGSSAIGACTPLPGDQTAGRGVRENLYSCEGCEAVLERSPMQLSATAQIADPSEPGERMVLTGRVLTADGRLPAADVVVYTHQTNAEGLYAGGSPGKAWSSRHGRLRGWAKTGADGVYTFRTIKPAPYPGENLPAHIHLYIGEPGRRPYYIDDVVFDGEFGVTPAYRAAQEYRGGSGIIRLQHDANGMLIARRDIRLERHKQVN